MTVECRGCGREYSHKYALVFGDNNNELEECHECRDDSVLGYTMIGDRRYN